MSIQNFTVVGMTCGHCAASVTEEVTGIDGVSNVDVDLASGNVTVTSSEPISDDAIRAAVEEAGYSVG
jgi:copper ion binding protein